MRQCLEHGQDWPFYVLYQWLLEGGFSKDEIVAGVELYHRMK